MVQITVFTVSDYSEYLRVLAVMTDPKYYGSTVATPAEIAAIPAPALPEIVFDSRGWSQQLQAANGDWFYIRRLDTGRYVIASANGRTVLYEMDGIKRMVVSFPGVLCIAKALISGPSPVPVLRLETISDYDRATNFGAF